MEMASASVPRARQRSGSGTARRTRRTAAPGVGAARQVRWDRLARVALLCVLVALAYLYLSAGVHMLSTWQQARRDSSIVAAMQREHSQLERQRETLGSQSTLEAEARQLGMMRKGEQPYVVSGLPDN